MQIEASSGAMMVAEGSRFGAFASQPEVVRAESLRKVFHSGLQEVVPLDGVSLSILRGELIAIIGPSGSGKSTLLHLLAALDTPTNGTVYFAGNSLSSLAESELAEYRNSRIGFVWQRHHLLPDFTAAENVAMPLLVGGMAPGQALRTAKEWLGEVGLASRSEQRAGQLSGGEQQRVAMARALVKEPALLLADEPTGDLDEQNAEHVFDLMQRLHRSHRLTSVFATHNLALARRADRVLVLGRGKLSPEAEAPAPKWASDSKTLGNLG
ncbi:MAG TPA: ABC transporter ATP-binding protein [Candidatus Acidoferrales bacterium]|nr:ABC transporter ATP-binding protein [Candidatus Acidoferrales bacterium]